MLFRPIAIVLTGLLLALLAILLFWMMPYQLPPCGGAPFRTEVLLTVPHFFQADPRWGQEPLAGLKTTLAQEGCAVTALAMILASYQLPCDPLLLNQFLTQNQGFTERGWLRWDQVPPFAPGRMRLAYEGVASYFLIDLNLWRRNPTIIRVRYPSGLTHFLVVVGKRGTDYLVLDPSEAGRNGPYPLQNFGSKIEALRYYLPQS